MISFAAAAAAPTEGKLDAAVRRVAKERVFFGHHSIGANIVDGLERQFQQKGLNIQRTTQAAAFSRPVFAHEANGTNSDPGSKITAFRKIIDNGVGAKTDIAMFKLCYVDFGHWTNVPALFAQYQSTMQDLRKTYPNVRFVHITTPLTTGEPGNPQRDEFNAAMRKAYAGKEPLFDLARLEATSPSGARVLRDGAEALSPAYAYDNGHLNAAGQDYVARELISFLATLN